VAAEWGGGAVAASQQKIYANERNIPVSVRRWPIQADGARDLSKSRQRNCAAKGGGREKREALTGMRQRSSDASARNMGPLPTVRERAVSHRGRTNGDGCRYKGKIRPVRDPTCVFMVTKY